MEYSIDETEKLATIHVDNAENQVAMMAAGSVLLEAATSTNQLRVDVATAFLHLLIGSSLDAAEAHVSKLSKPVLEALADAIRDNKVNTPPHLQETADELDRELRVAAFAVQLARSAPEDM